MAREDFKHLDSVDERLQKRSLWYAATGFRKPFPGDERVLTPEEAKSAEPGGGEAEEEAEEENE